jgi:hypothetical protein
VSQDVLFQVFFREASSSGFFDYPGNMIVFVNVLTTGVKLPTALLTPVLICTIRGKV